MKNILFENWNREKQDIHFSEERNFYIKEREIWYIKMGQNIGNEENGKDNFIRPVLVIKKVGNLFFTVALTSKGKENSIFYFKFKDLSLHNPRYQSSSYAILSQVKVMDKKRFVEHMGVVSPKEFVHVKQKLKTLLF